MSVLRMCAVHDSAVDAFNPPIFVAAVGAATRSFIDEVNRPDSAFYMHPDDFQLYELGTFDQITGTFQATEPVLVCRGKDVKRDPGS